MVLQKHEITDDAQQRLAQDLSTWVFSNFSRVQSDLGLETSHGRHGYLGASPSLLAESQTPLRRRIFIQHTKTFNRPSVTVSLQRGARYLGCQRFTSGAHLRARVDSKKRLNQTAGTMSRRTDRSDRISRCWRKCSAASHLLEVGAKGQLLHTYEACSLSVEKTQEIRAGLRDRANARKLFSQNYWPRGLRRVFCLDWFTMSWAKRAVALMRRTRASGESHPSG